jgi:cell division protein FtsW (lipid II flippase)
MKRHNLRYFLPLVVALPSVVVGAIAMKFYDIPQMIFAQNLASLLIAWLVLCVAVSFKHKNNKSNNIKVLMFISLILYILTYIDGGIGGVHRWISIGPIRLYVSSIILPILIIQLGILFSVKNELLAIVFTIIVSITLFFQPDASQLTAFVVPMIIIIISKVKRSGLRHIVTLLLVSLIILSWIFLDSLPPVPYVEEIVKMVSSMGMFWFILGIASLAMLPLPYILLAPKIHKLVSRCVGLYFILVIISTWFGNFPVPLMGFGVSPIIGYFAAITWLIKNKADLQN